MKNVLCTAALMAALMTFHASAHAAETLPAGTLITGTASGAASSLLGLDQGFADVPGSGITALAAADLEYLSSDYAAGIDFFTDGSVLVYGNTDTGSLPGSYILDFSFAGLSRAINSFTLGDLSAVTGGTISAGVLNASTIRLSFTDLTLTESFATFSAQIGLAAAVPEPSSWAMLGLGLLGFSLLRARRQTTGSRA